MTTGRGTPTPGATEARTVGVVGGGAWGRALAAAAARTGARVLLLSRRKAPDIAGVERLNDDAELADRARLVLLAVPSVVVRDVARSLGAHLDGRHFVVHGVRGLVAGGRGAGGEERARTELETIADVVRHETPVRRLGALGGPALAEELAAGRPSLMVAGSRYPEVLRELRALFGSAVLRLYATDDLLGLEWASALVGCLAIGVGYARGVGLGPGLIAAVITRAIDEAARLAAAAGGDERTLFGLAGTGDLLACIAQPERPEVLLGEALARGQALEGAVAAAGQRVEAVELIGRVAAWAEARGLRAPIFDALAHGVLRGRPPDDLVHQLMTGPAD